MSQEHRSSLGTSPGAKGRTVFGYAAKFNKRSENLGTKAAPWYEVIASGAFPDLLAQDVRALFNHEPSGILARSKFGKGSLKLSVDSVGLRYQFESPATQLGNDLLQSIKRGDIDQSSFGFIVAAGGEKWTKEGNAQIRTITKIQKLLDISPVTYPAYTDTAVSARNHFKVKDEHPSVTAAHLRLKLLSK